MTRSAGRRDDETENEGNNMNGIEKLRNVMEHWHAGSLVDWCRGVAYQIEREHQDALNERAETICELNREIAQLRADLAESKRDMTDEAREVVERLRAVSHDEVLRSANPDFEIVNELCKAVGIDRHSFETGRCRTYTGTLDAISDRLIELIEHGGKQDVDVVGLLELARQVESTRGEEDDPCRYFGRYNKPCGDCPAYHDDCGKVMLGDIAESIRKAIDGAPDWKCPHYHQAEHYCDAFGDGLRKRDEAACWVEQQGGLDVVRDYPKMDEFVAKLANELGVSDDIGCGDDLRLAISDELDKRLMPRGMEWPRFEDGAPVTIGDEVQVSKVSVEQCSHVTSVKISKYGSFVCFKWGGYDDGGNIPGERVKRPETEVLGADGLPIKAGETVYALQGEDPLIVSGYDGEFLKIKSGGLLRADYATHTPPDTQKRIDDDANEAEFRLDLLRRQRQLDARTMGGE